jgi:hypothetical protein
MDPNTHARASALGDRWERCTRTPLWHAAGCRCAGGAGCLLVNLASTETDLLESLTHQARLGGEPQAATLLLARLEGIRAITEQPSFSDWIRQLPDSDLPVSSVEWLLSGIERFVDSLNPPSAPRFTYTSLGDH